MIARVALVLAAGFAIGGVVRPDPAGDADRTITFTSTHTQESLSARYLVDGKYDPVALAQLDRVLRDHRTDEVGRMDPALFDYLYEVAARAGARAHFDVISGFRSGASNEMLRKRGNGVAQKSKHLEGKAIDVRLRGVDTARVRDIALALKRGGVGYYARPDFVHLDTGRVRHWSG